MELSGWEFGFCDGAEMVWSKATGQNMLEKALHELCQGKPESLDLLSAIVPIAKGNLAVLQIFQARLSDGNTENIAP